MNKKTPVLSAPFLIVNWKPDAGEVGWNVFEYLSNQLQCEEFAEIEPLGFFPLNEVQIANDLVQFPEAKFYAYEEKDLVLFKSCQPTSKIYKFLNLFLDLAESLKVKEIYTIGGLISTVAHTKERKIYTVVNNPYLKEEIGNYPLQTNLSHEGPTSMSGFLLWTAMKRYIPGISFWVDVPFYLSGRVDPKATKAILEFLKARFKLSIDLNLLDQEIEKQEEKIALLNTQNPEIGEYMAKLENNVNLAQEEMDKIINAVENYL
ncbi:MAG: hypothetical protein STSR0004_06980 [Peptococcaceae bacterium]